MKIFHRKPVSKKKKKKSRTMKRARIEIKNLTDRFKNRLDRDEERINALNLGQEKIMQSGARRDQKDEEQETCRRDTRT